MPSLIKLRDIDLKPRRGKRYIGASMHRQQVGTKYGINYKMITFSFFYLYVSGFFGSSVVCFDKRIRSAQRHCEKQT